MRRWTLERREWRGVVWTLRAATALAILMVVYEAARGELGLALAFGALAVVIHLMQRRAYRHFLGWHVDGRGERQKVVAEMGGTVLFEPTTRDERVKEQIGVTKGRREALAICAVTLAIVSAFEAYLAQGPQRPDDSDFLFSALGFLFGLLPFTLIFIYLVVQEVFYQFGYQDMAGAKVFDPPVIRPGLDNVAMQKAHGDARVATEAEALAMLKTDRAPP